MSILEVQNVSKSFGGVKANVDISMEVEKGTIVGLIGPNGSGKTTLFNSIVGTYPIDNGSIKFNGKEVSELPVPVIAKLGLLRTFQQTRIYGKLNCIDNMLISHKASDAKILSVFSKIPPELNEKAENLLNFVGLYQKRKLRAGDLSFGQQKLLELAMALMNEPEMLLLDEPTAGLDPQARRDTWNLIKKLKEQGKTIFLTTHYMEEAQELSDRILIIIDGKIVAEGSPDKLIEKFGGNKVIILKNCDKNLLQNHGFEYEIDSDEDIRISFSDNEQLFNILSLVNNNPNIEIEIKKPNLDEAKNFADAIHNKFPGKLLAYNCSPSFNWKKNLSDKEIEIFQKEIGNMGYKFQFITLAGFHAQNFAIFDLAKKYKRYGMAAYSRLQQQEFDSEKEGYTATKHQREVGTSYFDAVSNTISSGESSTTAMKDSTETEQF